MAAVLYVLNLPYYQIRRHARSDAALRGTGFGDG